MILISNHDLPILNNVFKQTLPNIHHQRNRQVTKNELLPHTSKILPKNVIERYHSALKILWQMIKIAPLFDLSHFLGMLRRTLVDR